MDCANGAGRRWAFNLTCLISSIFGLCLGASNNYNTFLVLTAFVGFGVGGNIPIDTTITLEFIPQVSHLSPPSILANISEQTIPARLSISLPTNRSCHLQRHRLRLHSRLRLFSQFLRAQPSHLLQQRFSWPKLLLKGR